MIFLCSFSVSFTGPSSVIHQQPVQLPIKFRAIHNGCYEDRIVLVLEDVSLGQQFVVSRPLRAIVGNKEDHELLKPKSPFVLRKRTRREPETEVISGEAPASTRAIPWVVKLPLGEIPKALAATLSRGSHADVMRALETSILPSVLTTNTYNRHHKTLLWVEEYRMEYNISLFTSSPPLTFHPGRIWKCMTYPMQRSVVTSITISLSRQFSCWTLPHS
jgi:helicase MOV-10